MNTSKLVYAIVLSWNHMEDTVECLESMTRSNYAPIKFLLVDNASTDSTVETVRKKFPIVEIIQSEKNLGISGGYNLGMKYALEQGASYILVANNDIEIDPDMINNLVREMDTDDHIGIGMPKIYHYYGDRNRLWCTGARWRKFIPSVKMTGVDAEDNQSYNLARDIEYAPSCCLLLRRELVEAIGYFDTNYFFYNDDWDYSARARKFGFKIRFTPDAHMWHKVSVSTQKSAKPAIWWNYFGRSTVRFYKFHATRWQLGLYTAWFVVRESIKGNFDRILPFLSGIRQANQENMANPI
jgi:GT2 family glycosyltransferase